MCPSASRVKVLLGGMVSLLMVPRLPIPLGVMAVLTFTPGLSKVERNLSIQQIFTTLTDQITFLMVNGSGLTRRRQDRWIYGICVKMAQIWNA